MAVPGGYPVPTAPMVQAPMPRAYEPASESFGFVGGGSLKDWLIIAILIIVGLSILGGKFGYPKGPGDHSSDPFDPDGSFKLLGLLTTYLGWMLLHPTALLVAYLCKFKTFRYVTGIGLIRGEETLFSGALGALTLNPTRFARQRWGFDELNADADRKISDGVKRIKSIENASSLGGDVESDVEGALRYLQEFGSLTPGSFEALEPGEIIDQAIKDLDPAKGPMKNLANLSEQDASRMVQALEKLKVLAVTGQGKPRVVIKASSSLTEAVRAVKLAANSRTVTRDIGDQVESIMGYAKEVMGDGKVPQSTKEWATVFASKPEAARAFARVGQFQSLDGAARSKFSKGLVKSCSPAELDNIFERITNESFKSTDREGRALFRRMLNGFKAPEVRPLAYAHESSDFAELLEKAFPGERGVIDQVIKDGASADGVKISGAQVDDAIVSIAKSVSKRVGGILRGMGK